MIKRSHQDFLIQNLIELTNKNNRNLNDIEYNPRLVLQIVDRAFVKCKLDNRNNVTSNDVCEAIKMSSKLKNSAKGNVTNKITNTMLSHENIKKVIEVNFRK